ncbi:hypothetical protein G7070_00385 [Propioniciclava coleopterorum]|uniref:Oxidoreductase family, NAD-binding Rossmann fold n=1 Tax=Propioniciclava coleopterorum TaxID=2714937 RepID=A0A6G7Y331_9ACTN|nr:hypothetical protein [Propioniciclava coleopterorum]QIK71017.1 hypothetical protein G7070_00385 [Propioniciclava coleopterorum]
MTDRPLSFLFLGHCSHTDLFAEHLARTGAGTVTTDPRHADAVCVFERDAATHAELALPHLRAGRPVFVDKPAALLACDVARMLEAGAVTSFSTLRWAPGLDALAGAVAVRVTGPARATDPSGAAFYAVHAVEIAHQICGGTPTEPDVRPQGDGWLVTYRLGAAAVELDVAAGREDWTVEATLPDGRRADLRISAGPGYYEPACAQILEFARTRRSPVAPAGLLGVAEVVEALGA